MDVANDNETVAAFSEAAGNSVLPPEFRETLDQCDRVGIGMDVLMNIFRARLFELGFDKKDSIERVLSAFRRVIERHS